MWWNVLSHELGLTQLPPHPATSTLSLPSDTVKQSQNHRTAEVGRDLWRSSGSLHLLKKDHLELAAQVILTFLSSSGRIRRKCQSTMCPYLLSNTFISQHLTRVAKPIFYKSCFKANYLHRWKTKQLIMLSSPFPQKQYFQAVPACTIPPRPHRTQQHLVCHRGMPPEPRGRQ